MDQCHGVCLKRCRLVHGGGRRLATNGRRGGQLGAHRRFHFMQPLLNAVSSTAKPALAFCHRDLNEMTSFTFVPVDVLRDVRARVSRAVVGSKIDTFVLDRERQKPVRRRRYRARLRVRPWTVVRHGQSPRRRTPVQ